MVLTAKLPSGVRGNPRPLDKPKEGLETNSRQA